MRASSWVATLGPLAARSVGCASSLLSEPASSSGVRNLVEHLTNVLNLQMHDAIRDHRWELSSPGIAVVTAAQDLAKSIRPRSA